MFSKVSEWMKHLFFRTRSKTLTNILAFAPILILKYIIFLHPKQIIFKVITSYLALCRPRWNNYNYGHLFCFDCRKDSRLSLLAEVKGNGSKEFQKGDIFLYFYTNKGWTKRDKMYQWAEKEGKAINIAVRKYACVCIFSHISTGEKDIVQYGCFRIPHAWLKGGKGEIKRNIFLSFYKT